MPFTYQFGLVNEGTQDDDAIFALINKIGVMNNTNFALHPHQDSQIVSTSTSVLIKAYARKLFETIGVEVAFIFADQDSKENKKRSVLYAKLNTYSTSLMERTFLAISEPHFEHWILCDEQLIKRYFNLDPNLPIPNPTYDPKDRLQHLVSLKGELFGDAKANLIDQLDIDVVRSADNNFDHFCRDVSSFVARNLIR